MQDHNENKTNNSLVPLDSKGLVRLENSIAITDKILIEINKIESMFNEAVSAMDLSKDNDNINYFRELNNLNDRNILFWNKYSLRVFPFNSNFTKITKTLKEVISIRQNQIPSYIALAIANLDNNQGNNINAINYCDIVLNLELNNLNAHYYKGYALYLLKNWQKAIEQINIVILIDINCVSAYELKSKVLCKMGLYHKAIEVCSIGLKIDPKKSSTYFTRGELYDKLHQYEEAISDYTNAIKFGYASIIPIIYLGYVYEEIGAFEKAIEIYTKGIESNYVGNKWCYKHRARVKAKIGDTIGSISDENIDKKLNAN